jgi:energy-coupling factor transporter transmembrane protein EcfT
MARRHGETSDERGHLRGTVRLGRLWSGAVTQRVPRSSTGELTMAVIATARLIWVFSLELRAICRAQRSRCVVRRSAATTAIAMLSALMLTALLRGGRSEALK